MPRGKGTPKKGASKEGAPKKVAPKKAAPTETALKNKFQDVETRLTQLETQVRFIMDKLTTVEIRMAGPVETLASTKIQPLKKLILRLIPQGTVISTDEIRAKKDFQNYPVKDLERALLELVDEEFFDVAEGQSRWTLSGNIGLLIRR